MARGRKKQVVVKESTEKQQQQVVEVPASNQQQESVQQVSLEDKIIGVVLNHKNGYGILEKSVSENSFNDFQNKLIWKACRTLAEMRVNIEASTICTCLSSHYNTSMAESTIVEKAQIKATIEEVLESLKQ